MSGSERAGWKTAAGSETLDRSLAPPYIYLSASHPTPSQALPARRPRGGLGRGRQIRSSNSTITEAKTQRHLSTPPSKPRDRNTAAQNPYGPTTATATPGPKGDGRCVARPDPTTDPIIIFFGAPNHHTTSDGRARVKPSLPTHACQPEKGGKKDGMRRCLYM